MITGDRDAVVVAERLELSAHPTIGAHALLDDLRDSDQVALEGARNDLPGRVGRVGGEELTTRTVGLCLLHVAGRQHVLDRQRSNHAEEVGDERVRDAVHEPRLLTDVVGDAQVEGRRVVTHREPESPQVGAEVPVRGHETHREVARQTRTVEVEGEVADDDELGLAQVVGAAVREQPLVDGVVLHRTSHAGLVAAEPGDEVVSHTLTHSEKGEDGDPVSRIAAAGEPAGDGIDLIPDPALRGEELIDALDQMTVVGAVARNGVLGADLCVEDFEQRRLAGRDDQETAGEDQLATRLVQESVDERRVAHHGIRDHVGRTAPQDHGLVELGTKGRTAHSLVQAHALEQGRKLPITSIDLLQRISTSTRNTMSQSAEFNIFLSKNQVSTTLFVHRFKRKIVTKSKVHPLHNDHKK